VKRDTWGFRKIRLFRLRGLNNKGLRGFIRGWQTCSSGPIVGESSDLGHNTGLGGRVKLAPSLVDHGGSTGEPLGQHPRFEIRTDYGGFLVGTRAAAYSIRMAGLRRIACSTSGVICSGARLRSRGSSRVLGVS
jgi:hypothetical protein